MPLYKDPRTGDIKEFENSNEAAGEGYYEEVKLPEGTDLSLIHISEPTRP